jgi:hypothetical protein
MPRQQCHLARDHAEFWPAPAARLGGLGLGCKRGPGQPRHDLLVRPAQIEVERATGRIAENDDGGDRLAGALHGKRDLGEAAGDQLPLPHKCSKALNHLEFPERPHSLSFIPGYNSTVNITRVINRLCLLGYGGQVAYRPKA